MIIHHQFGYCILLADPMECMKWAECILLYSNNLIRQVTTREPQIPGEIWPFSGERSGHSRALPSTKSLWDGVGNFFWPRMGRFTQHDPRKNVIHGIQKMSGHSKLRDLQLLRSNLQLGTVPGTLGRCCWAAWQDDLKISSRVNLGCCEPLVFWSLGVNTILVYVSIKSSLYSSFWLWG